jgi:hypothetical protein
VEGHWAAVSGVEFTGWGICDSSDFQGKSQALWGGESYTLSELTIGNDTLSSIRIPPGYAAYLYTSDNFGGTVKYLSAGDYVDLSSQSFNDTTSSIAIWGPTPLADYPVIYKDTNYAGSSQTLKPGLYPSSRYLTIGNDES